MAGFLKGVCLICFLSLSLILNAQEDHDHQHGDHGHSHQDHHKNEFGISHSPVYFFDEEVLAYGLHAHFIRNLKNSDFGIGLGFERVFDEKEYHTFSLVGSYSVTDEFQLILAPGISYNGTDEVPDWIFAFHVEAAYDFSVGDFHLGPILEIAYDENDIHIGLGLHTAYEF